VGKIGLIYSVNSRHSATFQNLFVKNFTVTGNGLFCQKNHRDDTKAIQTTFKLINATFQDLKQINYDLSHSSLVSNFFLLVQGPTNFLIDNLTVNNSIFYSKKRKFPTI